MLVKLFLTAALSLLTDYMSVDRSDTRFVIQELARRMAKLWNIDYTQLIPFGRYLRGKPRVINHSGYHNHWKMIDV